MSASMTDTTVDSYARPLFSWPPNPAMTLIQVMSRSGLLLNSFISLGLCFAAGATTAGSKAPFYFGGIFASILLLPTSLILLWNLRMLRNGPSKGKRDYEQLKSNTTNVVGRSSSRLGMLKLAAFIDLVGLVLFLIVYPSTAIGAAHSPRWGSPLLRSYASVTCLIPV